MYCVYLIQSKIDRTFYIGFTSNVQKGLIDHNKGKSKYTKPKKPYRLIYFEAYSSKSLARKREIELKKNSFRKKELIDRFIKAPSSSLV